MAHTDPTTIVCLPVCEWAQNNAIACGFLLAAPWSNAHKHTTIAFALAWAWPGCIICSILLFAIQFTIPFGWLFSFVSSRCMSYYWTNTICHANSAKDYYALFFFFFGILRLTVGNNFAMIGTFYAWPKPWPMSKYVMSSNCKMQKWWMLRVFGV